MAGDPYPSITIVKRFNYRGDSTEEWENTYHFSGGTPSSETRWKALSDAIIASEKTLYVAATTVVRAFGHEANNKVAVWSYDYLLGTGAVPGTLTPSTGNQMPGDVAAWIRWSTTQRTSLGKPIFLRNYYHSMFDSGATAPSLTETVNVTQKANMQTFGTAWVTGFSDGTTTYHRCGPNGAVGQVAQPSTYLTTRTLKKRGKRIAP